MNTRIWSLWDMLKLHARPFANLVFSLAEGERFMSMHRGKSFPEDLRPEMNKAFETFVHFCKDLELVVSADMAKSLETFSTFAELETAYSQVRNTIFVELNRRVFYGPEAKYGPYFEGTTRRLLGTIFV